MPPVKKVASWFLVIPSALLAQSVTINGVSNEVGNGRFSPGMRARIFVGLPANLSLEPGTVTVQVRGRPAPVLDVERAADYGGNQWFVHIQLPVDLASGLTTLVLTTRAGSSTPQNIQVEPYAPGLVRFTRQTPLGEVPVSFPPCPPPGEAVAAGEIVTAFAVGLGATDPVVPTGMRAPATPPAVTVVKPRISVLWQEAEVLESVLVPGEIGLYRVRFRVPPGDGWHPMALHIGGYDSFPLMLPVGRGLISASAVTWRSGPTAPESIMVASACANSLANAGPPGFTADPRNPPTTLGGTTVKVKDSAGAERLAPLYYVDRVQVNYVVPPGTALGSATVTVTAGDGTVSAGRLEIQPVAPGIFTTWAEPEFFDDDGIVPVGQVVRVRDGVRTVEPLFQVDTAGRIRRAPIELSRDTDEVYLVLYGTGIRFRSSLENVILSFGGSALPIEYAGPQGEFPGLDQVTVKLPFRRFGSGLGCSQVAVDGRFATVGCFAFK